MNQLRDPDAIIAAWLEDGPTDISAETRRAIVTGMRVLPRRRPDLLGGIPMPFLMRLAAAALVVAAVSFAILNLPGRAVGPGGVVSPSPSASPAPTPSEPLGASIDPRTPSPLDGVASEFPHPFRYRLIESENLVVTVSDRTLYQFRVPKPGTTNQYGNAIVVRVVTGGRADPCVAASAAVPFTGGPSSMVDYLQGIKGLTVSNIRDTTVSGMPAVRAVITAAAEAPSDCSDIWLWAEEGSFTQNAGWGATAELTAVDVGGDHVIIMAIGNVDWQTTSLAFISSIRFQ